MHQLHAMRVSSAKVKGGMTSEKLRPVKRCLPVFSNGDIKTNTSSVVYIVVHQFSQTTVDPVAGEARSLRQG